MAANEQDQLLQLQDQPVVSYDGSLQPMEMESVWLRPFAFVNNNENSVDMDADVDAQEQKNEMASWCKEKSDNENDDKQKTDNDNEDGDNPNRGNNSAVISPVLSQNVFIALITLFEKIFHVCDDNENVYLYGDILGKILKNERICDKDCMYVLLSGVYLNQIDEIIADLNATLVTKYRMFSSVNGSRKQFNNAGPNYFHTIFDLHANITIQIIFQMSGTNTKTYLFDCDNLMLNKNGFCLYDAFGYNEQIFGKYPSSFILHSIRNIVRDECSLVNVQDLHTIRNNTHSLFNLIHEQNQLIARGKTINRGIANIPVGNAKKHTQNVTNVTNMTNMTNVPNTRSKNNAANESTDEAKCGICYEGNDHPDTFLYMLECNHIFCSNCIEKHMCCFLLLHNNDCPQCRQKILFKIKDDLID